MEMTSHNFSASPDGNVFCTQCGYVSHVSDSTYARNNLRQKNIPEKCAHTSTQNEEIWRLRNEILRLRDEMSVLESWKAEQLRVESQWSPQEESLNTPREDWSAWTHSNVSIGRWENLELGVIYIRVDGVFDYYPSNDSSKGGRAKTFDEAIKRLKEVIQTQEDHRVDAWSGIIP